MGTDGKCSDESRLSSKQSTEIGIEAALLKLEEKQGEVNTKWMYYDKDLKTLDSLVTQTYNLLDVMKTRRELEDVVQISSSVFTRINTERYKGNHPEMFYAFRLDDVIIQGVKEHGLYFIRIVNSPFIVNNCIPLESSLNTQISIKKLKTVDELGTLFRTIVKNFVEDKVTPRELF